MAAAPSTNVNELMDTATVTELVDGAPSTTGTDGNDVIVDNATQMQSADPASRLPSAATPGFSCQQLEAAVLLGIDFKVNNIVINEQCATAAQPSSQKFMLGFK